MSSSRTSSPRAVQLLIPRPPRPNNAVSLNHPKERIEVLSKLHNESFLTLVGVFSATEQFVLSVLGDIDAVIRELCPFVMIARRMCQKWLHRRNLNLVCNGLMVDGIADVSVLNHEDPTRLGIKIQSACFCYRCLNRSVSVTMWIE
jgi:hypothetical protein